MKLTDTQTATIRTAMFGLVTMIVVNVLSRVVGFDVAADDPIVAGIVGAVMVVLYPLAVKAAERIPFAGNVLFLVNKKPTYAPPAPSDRVA